jgi:DNA adenine methylase
MTLAPARIVPPLKYHGGKHYLARKIIALMPPHRNYVEPFAGGLSVLLAKEPEGVSEVVNDLDGELTNFWRVLQNEKSFARFQRIVSAVPFSEAEWLVAADRLTDRDPVRRAVAFFIRCRMSLAGRGTEFAAISTTRLRRGRNEQVSAWTRAVEGLPAVHERLWQRVAVLNRDALDVIRRFDKPDTVIYSDPPYLPDTRTAPDVYRYEMSRDQHAELLRVVRGVRHAPVLLSGYPNDLYDTALSDWRRHTFDLPNNAAGGTSKRRMVECVWSNFG